MEKARQAVEEARRTETCRRAALDARVARVVGRMRRKVVRAVHSGKYFSAAGDGTLAIREVVYTTLPMSEQGRVEALLRAELRDLAQLGKAHVGVHAWGSGTCCYPFLVDWVVAVTIMQQ